MKYLLDIIYNNLEPSQVGPLTQAELGERIGRAGTARGAVAEWRVTPVPDEPARRDEDRNYPGYTVKIVWLSDGLYVHERVPCPYSPRTVVVERMFHGHVAAMTLATLENKHAGRRIRRVVIRKGHFMVVDVQDSPAG